MNGSIKEYSFNEEPVNAQLELLPRKVSKCVIQQVTEKRLSAA